MPCSNCYNSCTDIVSDKCVKYTGFDVPALGIQTGDSLSYVEQALIEFLTSTLDGTGIIPILGDTAICEVVQKYLPDCEPITLNDILQALIKAACDIQTQVTTLRGEMNTLNADYNVGCLSDVTNSSDTHLVVQAIITKLCQLGVDLAALSIDVSTNYVKLSQLNSLIQNYLNTLAPSGTTNYNTRMIPYSIIPYYSTDISQFNSTGAGTGLWTKIYLCNGQNGTPDLRGRALTGVILPMPGGGPMSAAVDPASSPFNPNYGLGTTIGSNSVTLTTSQMPTHTHILTDPGHKHSITITTSGSDFPNGGANYPVFNTTTDGGGVTATNPVGLNGTLLSPVGGTGITMATAGGSTAHANIQPVIATYYIMYIP